MRRELSALIQSMNEDELRDALLKLVEEVQDLEQDDYFGTEGLVHFFGLD